MNLTITARRFKLPRDLRDYIEEKVQRLERYHDGIMNMEVILGWEKLTRYVEFKVKLNNNQVVLKESSDDLRKSFDLALDRVERQLKRQKEKLRATDKERIHSA